MGKKKEEDYYVFRKTTIENLVNQFSHKGWYIENHSLYHGEKGWGGNISFYSEKIHYNNLKDKIKQLEKQNEELTFELFKR